MIGEEVMEVRVDAHARFAAEDVREINGVLLTVLRQHRRVADRRRHREEIRADVHDAEQHHLFALQLRLITHHGVENRTREVTRCPFDESHVAGELSELSELGESRPADVPRGIPRRIVRARFRGGRELQGSTRTTGTWRASPRGYNRGSKSIRTT